MNNKKHQMATKAIHAGDKHNPTPAVVAPIYQSATYHYTDPAILAGFMHTDAPPQFYGRFGSPNTAQVEATMAELEGAEAGLATASGMAAVSLILLTFLKAGDHLVTQTRLYPTTSRFMRERLPGLGISLTEVDQTDAAAFAAACRPETKLIYVETPANPLLTMTDLAAIATIGRQRGILTIADNTFATPFNQRPISLGIDLVLHSATKYLGGHSDIVAGVITGSKTDISRLWHTHIHLGAILHPFEAWLLERGLKTFTLRMAAHNANGLAIAQFLQAHPAVAAVHYPGLATHPQHTLAQKQMPGGFSGMVSFELKGGREAGYQLLQKVKLIRQAVSLGGVHSLITHPASTVSAVQDETAVAATGVRPGLVRLSVGLEAAVDLIADLKQALEE